VQKAREAVAREKAGVAKMRSDIDALNREVGRLMQQLEGLRKEASPPQKGKKK
jgi:predicted  nucleic acid-binding Zn-ribbon protein